MCRCRLLVAALLFSFPFVHAQTSVHAAQQALLQLSAQGMETTVSIPIQTSILTLKQALTEQTASVLATVPAKAGVVQLQRALRAALPAESVGTRTDAEWVALGNRKGDKAIAGLYGGGLHVAVTQPRPGLLLVVERFDIACGSDNLLLAYRAEGGRWRRILRWDTGRYDQISGAFGDSYETRILRPMRNGHPLLLVLHGTPWCTSTMSNVAMDVFELDVADDKPIWHGEHEYRRLDLEPPLTLRATADGVEVSTSVNVWSGGDTVSRKGVIRYAMRSGGIHRALPLATNALGTLEEWLGVSREEAREFADDVPGSLTWQIYDTLTWRGVKDSEIDAHFTAEYGAVRACREHLRHFQIDVATSRGYGAKEEHGTTYYVQMTEVPNGYRMHAVTSQPDARCTGPDLMAKP